MKIVSAPSRLVLGDEGFDFCPGCGYGSILLALADVVAALDRPPVFIIDIGCVDFMTAHLPGDVMMGPHGRATALAVTVKDNSIKYGLEAAFFLIAMIFVYRSFYGMRIHSHRSAKEIPVQPPQGHRVPAPVN